MLYRPDGSQRFRQRFRPPHLRSFGIARPAGISRAGGSSTSAESDSLYRVYTAADKYAGGEFLTLNDAAEACGSNVAYVSAMITVLRAEDYDLLGAIFDGRVPLLTAARAVKQTAALLAACRLPTADDANRFAFTRRSALT